MKPIPDNIKDFIENNKICTICFVDDNNTPYCINCFYFFDSTNNLLVFKSSNGTNHSSLTIEESLTSGTILPETIEILKLKGLQFIGKIISNKDLNTFGASFNYHKKFPMSLAMPGYIWAIKLSFLKLTDNTLGIGNKITWTNK